VSISFEGLALLVVLLPGFLSSLILSQLTVRTKPDTSTRVVEALLFSWLNYALLAGLFGVQPSLIHGDVEAALVANARFALAAMPTSLLFPMILAWLITKNYHMRVLRKVGITRHTSRATVWLDVLLDQERYVVCHLSDGRRVFGWPAYYSDTGDDQLLYLQDPAWITDDGAYLDLGVHGLFLVKREGIDSIAFTHITRKNAKPRQKEPDDVEEE
jgi:hypothetical protein